MDNSRTSIIINGDEKLNKKVYHELEPIYHKEDTILILGSFPSIKSRNEGFYYSHPKNRFWKILAQVYNEPIPKTIPEKQSFLNKHHIALWDVVASCIINNSMDASIKNVKSNDINMILKKTKITKIFTLGQTATTLYKKYCYPKTKRESIYLPSTSPANCKIKDEELQEIFAIIKE